MCEHPLHIHGYTVPCGKCNGCKADRQQHYSLLCGLEETRAKYCYFVTLTYAPEWLPTVHAVYDERELPSGNKLRYYDFVADNPHDSNYGKTLFHYKFKDDKDKLELDRIMWQKTHLWRAALGYLNYEDPKNFIRRLRRRYEYRYKETLRFITVGEYGPETYRPHWHILLYFDSPRIQADIVKGVLSCWTFGRVDISASLSKVSSYVAGYLSSSLALPRVYKNRVMSSKVRHSEHFGCQELVQEKKEEIYEQGYSFFDGYECRLLGKLVQIHPWRSLVNQLFPRCSGYDKRNHSSRLFAYRMYRTAEELYGEGHSLTYYVRAIFEDIYNDVDNVLTNYVTEYCRPYESKYMNCCYSLESESHFYNRLYNVIVRDLSISRAVYKRLCDCDWSRLNDAVDMIERFYKDKDYFNLCDMYRNQELDASSGVLPETLASYYPQYDDDKVRLNENVYAEFEIKPYRSTVHYADACCRHKMFVDRSVKRKMHNDKNGVLLNYYEY